jgi:hypothetical protein
MKLILISWKGYITIIGFKGYERVVGPCLAQSIYPAIYYSTSSNYPGQ